ncbi:MAG: RNA polymerase sigma factor [Pirellulaceae bacterium]
MQHSDSRRQRYETAVEQFSDSTYRVAYRLTSDHELARELVQETFMAAWKNLDQLQNQEAMKGWLFSILRNQYSKQVGREKRNQHARIDNESETASRPTTTKTQHEVQEAIARLDDDQRLPLLLVSMEGWTVDEASELLAVPRGTILSRLHRARQRLKKWLAPDVEMKSNES